MDNVTKARLSAQAERDHRAADEAEARADFASAVLFRQLAQSIEWALDAADARAAS